MKKVLGPWGSGPGKCTEELKGMQNVASIYRFPGPGPRAVGRPGSLLSPLGKWPDSWTAALVPGSREHRL